MIKIPVEKLLKKQDRTRHLLFLVNTSISSNYKQLSEYRQPHLDYLHKLDQEGVLVAAGPTLDESGSEYQGSGFIIISAQSASHAESMVEADPYHINKVRSFVITPWLLSEGFLASKLG